MFHLVSVQVQSVDNGLHRAQKIHVVSKLLLSAVASPDNSLIPSRVWEISRHRNEDTIILMPNKVCLGILLRVFHFYHDMPERMSPVIYMYVVELRHRSDSVVGISSR